MTEYSSQSETRAGESCFCGGAGPRLTEQARRVRANVTLEHFRNAGIEVLKGFRSVLDLGIDRLAREGQPRGASVNVE